ncbi:hypothetical protein DICPUDRAFT_78483 [Dictyostelium purpureum]|uniref:Uncharacterized protein n=1 Tax=Dictyostelium purpureum TaxID=5786 RepID=F0ZJP4_DICPU|nr:uncharacterized protein DICPUDRAFT_78483 [Dictyostelium purpureum]EGC35850.1 hypothetical protein DICPUDRAFT_78483 [Dictyostelium purpureum]|eukprot:XP_003287639.1 hypothetical protein DICPUDRAFT_78483 [Dictyostelium purpureum]
MKQSLEQFGKSIEYFCNLYSIPQPTKLHLKTNKETITYLVDLSNEIGCPLTSIAHLSTNPVELFFSLVRSKVHYPSYYEFCIYEKSAYKELIKSKIVQNNRYEASIKKVNKCYGSLQTKLDGNVIPESVKLVSKYREEEVRVFERIIKIIEPDEYEESEDSSFPFTDSMSADERRRVITLTFYLKRILSIRELSCFGEQTRFKASGRAALQVCIFDGCQAMFANSASYESHVTQPHQILSKEDVQKYKQVLEDQEKFKKQFNDVFGKFETQPDQSKCNIFILDSETTDLTSNAEIIELSCACLNGEAFYRKSNPTIPITPESTKINNLTSKDLAGHQYWEKVEENFLILLSNNRQMMMLQFI